MEMAKTRAIHDMTDKVCLVTGANSGLGKATALGLARLGARVILACRDPRRGQHAVQEIRKQVAGARVERMIVDLASLPSIAALVDEFARRYTHLDVLVNNAGLLHRRRRETDEGLEVHFAVNHLGPFRLTNLLLRPLQAAPRGRIITVSSGLHRRGAMHFDDLQAKASFGGLKAYANSKLANVLFTYELARKLQGSSVTANCLEPGVVATNFFRELPAPARWLGGIFLASPDKGARTSIFLATSPQVEGVSGKYFANQRETLSSELSCDRAVATRLWTVSAKLAGIGVR